MKKSLIRAKVKELCPQARYLNLSDTVGPCHCVVADVNDRYLAYSESSRKRAWYVALRTLMALPPEEMK